MSNKPLKVGITGGIGSGKSTVVKIFNILGIPSYESDKQAKKLMQESEALKKAIQEKFGVDAYDPSGKLNNQYLAQKVFGDPEAVAQLNQLVHPAVRADFSEWAKHQNSPYVLNEAALLFETGSYQSFDQMILVTAPESVRITRVMFRDTHRTLAQIKQIIAQQIDPKEAAKLAQLIIKNDDQSLIIPQVLKAHQKLLQLSQA